MDGAGGNGQVRRSTAVLSVPSIAAQSIVDVTWAPTGGCRFGGATPMNTDRVVTNPVGLPTGLVGMGLGHVTATNTISARFTNPSTATIAAQTVTVNVTLIKAHGSI